MSERKIPWIIKYRPKRVDDVIGQDEAKKTIISWLTEWAKGRIPYKKALLLYGPPGVGKTSLVEAIARELNFDILELNASDYRRKSDIRRIVGTAATKKPLLKKGLIILLDEVDGIDPRADEGGLEALVDVIKNTINPIIMTANDPWKEQFRVLRELCELVDFKELTENQIIALLQKICDSEKIYCEREALRWIASRSMGDARAAINDLQAVAEGYGKVTIGLVRAIVRGREKTINIWRTLNEIFYANQAWTAKKAVTQSEEDYESLIRWLNDNIPKKYSDPLDLFRAYDALARATVMLSRAKISGEWGLLSYVFDLMGPGVSLARRSEEILKTRYGFPDWIRLMAQLKPMREEREKLAEHLSYRILASKSTIMNEVIPYMMLIFRNPSDPVIAARLALGYNLSKDMIKYLAGDNTENVIRALEKIKRARPEEVGKETKREPEKREARKEKSSKGLDYFIKS